MATQPINAGGVVALPGIIPAMPAVARILARYDRPMVAAFIAIAIDLLDTFDGDADCEDGDPMEANGDEQDLSWPNLVAQRAGMGAGLSSEDDEPDDFAEQDDPAGQCDEDGINTAQPIGMGSGCDIADAGEPDRRDLRKVKSGDDLREI